MWLPMKPAAPVTKNVRALDEDMAGSSSPPDAPLQSPRFGGDCARSALMATAADMVHRAG